MVHNKPDFEGWATVAGIRCSDGRTIMNDAFADDDGQVVPLVWQHNHSTPEAVLGHCLLENRGNGVYAYGYFNNSKLAKAAKQSVNHGDITAMSIYANGLKHNGANVLHGSIKEVSLVLAGANPGACIMNTDMSHSLDDSDDIESAIIFNDDGTLYHSDEGSESYNSNEEGSEVDRIDQILDSMTDEQLEFVHALVANNDSDDSDSDYEDEDEYEDEDDEYDENDENYDYDDVEHSGMEGYDMYNAFDGNGMAYGSTLSHAEFDDLVTNTFADVKNYGGSLRDSWLAHADDAEQTYGIADIHNLFPQPKEMNNPPEFIKRDTDWVADVMSSVHKTPFSRIKTSFADITADAARAKGYLKGKRKKEEIFTLLKRETTPTTIYKKQKLDKDDISDIIDFDVVAWIKAEMRIMLDEEIARAILVGDGRLPDDEDKIREANIRPIWNDDDLYSIKAAVEVAADADEDTIANAMIRKAIKARKDYKGSGNPVLYTTESQLADMLLLEDGIGRLKYTLDTLKQALRVSNIVTVPVMENLVRTFTVTEEGQQVTKSRPLLGIIVNLRDYNVGADKGGAVNLFDDFDINFNQQIYLIETRCSGALVKPFSAIILELEKAAA
jgi:hypothetical protein